MQSFGVTTYLQAMRGKRDFVTFNPMGLQKENYNKKRKKKLLILQYIF
jgi:hypothetical protein